MPTPLPETGVVKGRTGEIADQMEAWRRLNRPRGPHLIVAAADAPGWSIDAAARNGASTLECDGTDDQVQVETAMGDLPTGGGKIILSAGNHQWSASPDFPDKESITIEGAGPGQEASASQPAVGTRVNLAAGFADTVGLRVQRASDDRPIFGVYLYDFTIDCALRTGVTDGILFRSNRGGIDKVHVYRSAGDGIRILGYSVPALWATYDTILGRLQVGECVGVGLNFDTQAQDCHLLGAVLLKNGTNLRIAAGSQQITGLHTYDAEGRNAVFQGGSRTKIVNWKCEGANQEGVLFDGTTTGASDIVIATLQLADNSRAGDGLYAHMASTGTQAYTRTTFNGLNISRKSGTVILASYAFDWNSAMRDTVISGFQADPTHFRTGVFRDNSPAANRTIWGNRNQPFLLRGDGVTGTPALFIGGTTQPAGMQVGDLWAHDA